PCSPGCKLFIEPTGDLKITREEDDHEHAAGICENGGGSISCPFCSSCFQGIQRGAGRNGRPRRQSASGAVRLPGRALTGWHVEEPVRPNARVLLQNSQRRYLEGLSRASWPAGARKGNGRVGATRHLRRLWTMAQRHGAHVQSHWGYGNAR